jgi:2',3'-cyclic-nucleotide 2'-phosphodiesterase (5'-nucleotidase family)
VRTREAAIGDLIADAMREAGRADAAVTNGGGIRGGKIYAPGAAITRRDILAELPFGNRIVTVAASGADLKLALENGLSQLPRPAGRFPQVSGLTVEADTSRPAGDRIVSIKVGDAPLDESRIYRVAVNDFMARGGDGYSGFAELNPVVPLEDAPLLSDEVMIYLHELPRISSTVEGRLTAK